MTDIRRLHERIADLEVQLSTKMDEIARLRNDTLEEAAKIAEGYDRCPFPGFEAGIGLVKKDIAYRVRKAALKPATGEQPTGVWPDWGDSPNGFDGPGGAE